VNKLKRDEAHEVPAAYANLNTTPPERIWSKLGVSVEDGWSLSSGVKKPTFVAKSATMKDCNKSIEQMIIIMVKLRELLRVV
jgi:hypothetical protein